MTPRRHLQRVHEQTSALHHKAASALREMGAEHERAANDWPEGETIQRAAHANIAKACGTLADAFAESSATHAQWARDLAPTEKSAGASSLAALLEE